MPRPRRIRAVCGGRPDGGDALRIDRRSSFLFPCRGHEELELPPTGHQLQRGTGGRGSETVVGTPGMQQRYQCRASCWLARKRLVQPIFDRRRYIDICLGRHDNHLGMSGRQHGCSMDAGQRNQIKPPKVAMQIHSRRKIAAECTKQFHPSPPFRDFVVSDEHVNRILAEPQNRRFERCIRIHLADHECNIGPSSAARIGVWTDFE